MEEVEDLLASMLKNYDDWTTHEPPPVPFQRRGALFSFIQQICIETYYGESYKAENVKKLPSIKKIL